MTEQHLLGWLYVTTPRAYLSVDHDSVRVETDDGNYRIPLMGVDGIVATAARAVSGRLIERLVETGRSLTLLDQRGMFMGRLIGPTSGNEPFPVSDLRSC